MILRALKDVDIPIEELIDFAFYVADEIFKKENRYPSNWLKEFVLFVRNLQTPYRFPRQRRLVLAGHGNSQRASRSDQERTEELGRVRIQLLPMSAWPMHCSQRPSAVSRLRF